jgi:hypothetical protein
MFSTALRIERFHPPTRSNYAELAGSHATKIVNYQVCSGCSIKDIGFSLIRVREVYVQ